MDLRLSRRALLGAGGGLLLASTLPRLPRAADPVVEYRLRARAVRAPLVGDGYPDTAVWSYGEGVPGPELRVRQGQRLRVIVENALDQSTTVHWHGIRLPNAMDGVPGLTQPPIAPGETFVYEFTPPDAGTFWYHSHVDSAEQIGRGLFGALIVEEPEPPAVDREWVWVLNDWRLDREARIVEDFGTMHDLSHGGRIGNTVTVNGRIVDEVSVRPGERIRLRLTNAASARHYALRLGGPASGDPAPWIIALDGQPVEPHRPDDGRVVLAPGARADLLLDVNGFPGRRIDVIDDFYPRFAYRLLTLVHADGKPAAGASAEPLRLPDNPLPEPDLKDAARHVVTFEGGAMGSLRRAEVDGETLAIRVMAQRGLVWAVNGVAETHASLHAPMLELRRGRSYVFELRNHTTWPHPIHLHGHHFRVLARDGRPLGRPEWRDTELLLPDGSARVAFVADNPGDWMLHCHVLSHQMAGMMRVIRVV